MDVLYSQNQMVNFSEGGIIGKFFDKDYGLALFNKNILKVYSVSHTEKLELFYQKSLYENIILIERYQINEYLDGLVVVLESTKIIMLFFMNNKVFLHSLKYFKKEDFDIKDQDTKILRVCSNIGILKLSKYYFSIFSLRKNFTETKAFKFTDISEKIKNVIDLVFLTNYTKPTICLLYNSVPSTYLNNHEFQAIISSYDPDTGNFFVLEEFNVPHNTHRVVFNGNTLVFLATNDIVFRTINSCLAIGLNCFSVKNKHKFSQQIVLNKEEVFFRDENLIIFNGDGKIYKLKIIFDNRRVIDVCLDTHSSVCFPQFITWKDDYLFLGSYELSIFCRINFEGNKELEVSSKRIKVQDDLLEEYNKLFNDLEDSKDDKNVVFEIKEYFKGLGYVNDFCLKDLGNYVIVSEGVNNYIIESKDYLSFKIKEKIANESYDTVFTNDLASIVTKEGSTRLVSFFSESVNHELELLTDVRTYGWYSFGQKYFQILKRQIRIINKQNFSFEDKDFDFNIKLTESLVAFNKFFMFILSEDGKLLAFNEKMKVLIELNNIKTFTFSSEFLYYVSFDVLYFLSLKSFKVESLVKDLSFLNKSYDLIPIVQGYETKANEENILEIFYYKNIREFILLITHCGNFAIYQIDNKSLQKRWIDRFITFNTELKGKFLSKANDFVHIKADKPLFMYIKRNELFFYLSHYNLLSLTTYKENFIFLTDTNIIRAKSYKEVLNFEKNNKLFSSSLFTNHKYLESRRTEDTISYEIIYDRLFYRKVKINRTPKNIELADSYIVMATCEDAPFKHEENVDQGIDVQTSKYYIDLYTQDYKYISSYDLDPDEYVFDIKYLTLNDPLGFNDKNNFVVVCTTKIEGEDKQSRGRLVVLELSSIVPDEKNKYKDKKLKLIGSENIKGCITKCDEIEGNIAVSLGIKLMVYKIDRSNGLVPIGIHDMHTLTTSMAVIKNYILASDIYKGLAFFYYQRKPVRLNLLCTSEPINYAVHVKYLVKNNRLSMICVDGSGNFHVYTYSPKNILSAEGSNLVKRLEICSNLGRLVSIKDKKRVNNPVFISETNFKIELRGLESKTYIILFKVQLQIFNYLNNNFGLHPHGWLNLERHLKTISIKKPIIKELFYHFINFDTNKQKIICKECDTSFDELKTYLKEYF